MPKKRNYDINMFDINEINKTIGKNVKILRLSKDLTQEQLAEIIGLERKSITAIETGRTFISCEVLANLSNFINVEPSFFFKSNRCNLSGKNNDLQKKIKRILLSADDKKLNTFYNIIIALDG